MKIVPLLSALLLLPLSWSHAVILVSYDFDSNSAAPTSVDPALDSASDFTGVFSGTGDWALNNNTTWNRTRSVADSDPGAGADTSRWTFTIDPGTSILDLQNLTFQFGGNRSSGQPDFTAGYVVRSSLDGYTSVLGSNSYLFSQTLTYHPETIDLSGLAFDSITAPLTFRIYLWSPDNNGQQYIRTDTYALNGAVVPEPAAFALIGGLSMAAWVVRRRRSRT